MYLLEEWRFGPTSWSSILFKKKISLCSWKTAMNWGTAPVNHWKCSGRNNINVSVGKLKIWLKRNAGKAPEMGRKPKRNWNKNCGVHKMRLLHRHLLYIFFLSFFLSFSRQMYRQTDGPTDQQTDILMSFLNCPRLSWSLSNFVLIGTWEMTFFVVWK